MEPTTKNVDELCRAHDIDVARLAAAVRPLDDQRVLAIILGRLDPTPCCRATAWRRRSV